MAADVCLLLMQSLTGDCKADLPATLSAPIASLEAQAASPVQDGGEMAVAPPAAIAPLAAPPQPQFTAPEKCAAAPISPVEGCPNPASRQLPEPSSSVPIVPGTEPPLAMQPEGRSMANHPPALAEAMAHAAAPSPASPLAPVTTPVALNIPLRQRPVPQPAIQGPQFSSPETLPVAPPRLWRPTTSVRPTNGAQLYRQRQLALQAGQVYTRLAPNQFADQWQPATGQPSYEAWRRLLAQEARAVAGGQGSNRLEVVVGDSFGMWLPPDALPRDRLWLNQGISGDTTAGILQRLDTFAATRPTTIHLLAGANDLKTGVPEAQIVHNLQLTVQRLRQQHPQAQIVVYSVLPTRRADIENNRVRSMNAQLANLSRQAAVEFRDLQPFFRDEQGALRSDLTTDGLHLNAQGYALWQRAILASGR